jgi:hypothetical protein
VAVKLPEKWQCLPPAPKSILILSFSEYFTHPLAYPQCSSKRRILNENGKGFLFVSRHPGNQFWFYMKHLLKWPKRIQLLSHLIIFPMVPKTTYYTSLGGKKVITLFSSLHSAITHFHATRRVP